MNSAPRYIASHRLLQMQLYHFVRTIDSLYFTSISIFFVFFLLHYYVILTLLFVISFTFTTILITIYVYILLF